ncbi:MAG: exopolyphosphatase [Crocinitomix sp.]|nr:exopolyphosphatase [Crocinitomix sp.]
MKFGAIDIGTNAARLLIGEVDKDDKKGFVKKVSYTRIPLRLGMEVFENGLISEQKAEEFKKSMLAFKLIAEVFHVVELRACATSAMREASNGKAIQAMIKKETGVSLEIIDGDQEASIIFSSFLLVDDYDLSQPFIVIDVGGGSTEISIFYEGEKTNAKSFQIGTIRMIKDKVDNDIWPKIEAWLDKHVRKNKDYLVFGTGGNINKIHKLLGKKGNESIPVKELKELSLDLRSLSLSKRISKYKLKPDRADVIVPATKIFLKIVKKLACEELFVPKIGLSDGMIHQMHRKYSNKKLK